MTIRSKAIVLGTAFFLCAGAFGAPTKAKEVKKTALRALPPVENEEAQPDHTFVLTIKKKPKSREEAGPVLIYRFSMSGYANYQWVVVPTAGDKRYLLELFKAVKLTGRSETLGVETSQEHIADLRGSDREQRAAQLEDDLKGHSAVVFSYENDPAQPDSGL